MCTTTWSQELQISRVKGNAINIWNRNYHWLEYIKYSLTFHNRYQRPYAMHSIPQNMMGFYLMETFANSALPLVIFSTTFTHQMGFYSFSFWLLFSSVFVYAEYFNLNTSSFGWKQTKYFRYIEINTLSPLILSHYLVCILCFDAWRWFSKPVA